MESVLNSQLNQTRAMAHNDAVPAQGPEEFELLNRYWDAANYL